MTEPVAPPTRLERIVDVLAKLTGALWALGLLLLILNSAALHKHDLYAIALDAIRAGFALALVIVISILGTQAVKKARAKS